MGRSGRDAQEGGDMCMHIADPHYCTAETKQHWEATLLQFKNKQTKNKIKWDFLERTKGGRECRMNNTS